MALTGYGELVEVDDKLGVEIHSYIVHNNVKYHFADSYTNIIYILPFIHFNASGAFIKFSIVFVIVRNQEGLLGVRHQI